MGDLLSLRELHSAFKDLEGGLDELVKRYRSQNGVHESGLSIGGILCFMGAFCANP